jgi:hypothetical protein
MDYLEGENITVEVGRKAVRVCSWGSQPFARVLRKDGSFAWISNGFQCITKEAGLQLLGETRVDQENGSAFFRFSVIGQAHAVGEWRANPTAALDNVHALVKNAKHRVGANGNVVIGITYDNLQRRINELRQAQVQVHASQQKVRRSRPVKVPPRRRSSRFSGKGREVVKTKPQILGNRPRSMTMMGENDFDMLDLPQTTTMDVKRQRIIDDEEEEPLVFDFPEMDEEPPKGLIFVWNDGMPLNTDEDEEIFSTIPLFECDVDVLTSDLGLGDSGLEPLYPPHLISSKLDGKMSEEEMEMVGEKKEFLCESSNSGMFDCTSADDLLQANDEWWDDL